MTSMIYKFAYWYLSGDGSCESDPYTDKEEAIKAFKEFVNDELIDDFTEEELKEHVDYAMLWAEDSGEPSGEPSGDEQKGILYWTYEYGYTDYDPPSKE